MTITGIELDLAFWDILGFQWNGKLSENRTAALENFALNLIGHRKLLDEDKRQRNYIIKDEILVIFIECIWKASDGNKWVNKTFCLCSLYLTEKVMLVSFNGIL